MRKSGEALYKCLETVELVGTFVLNYWVVDNHAQQHRAFLELQSTVKL